MTTPPLTTALEDYLETIYELAQVQGFARVKDIAGARNVKAGSVTPALKRLASMDLIHYAQREYIRLTPAGEVAARRVLARHRVLRRFLHGLLKMPLDEADTQACALEHSLTDDAMDRIVGLFEYLDADPGGAAFIDGLQAYLDAAPATGEETMTLMTLSPGQTGKVRRVLSSGAIRQRLLDMGLMPGTEIFMERTALSGEPVWIRAHGAQLALRRAEAEAILITG